jgi:hypothetical protein
MEAASRLTRNLHRAAREIGVPAVALPANDAPPGYDGQRVSRGEA